MNHITATKKLAAAIRKLAPTHLVVNVDENEKPTVEALAEFAEEAVDVALGQMGEGRVGAALGQGGGGQGAMLQIDASLPNQPGSPDFLEPPSTATHLGPHLPRWGLFFSSLSTSHNL